MSRYGIETHTETRTEKTKPADMTHQVNDTMLTLRMSGSLAAVGAAAGVAGYFLAAMPLEALLITPVAGAALPWLAQLVFDAGEWIEHRMSIRRRQRINALHEQQRLAELVGDMDGDGDSDADDVAIQLANEDLLEKFVRQVWFWGRSYRRHDWQEIGVNIKQWQWLRDTCANYGLMKVEVKEDGSRWPTKVEMTFNEAMNRLAPEFKVRSVSARTGDTQEVNTPYEPVSTLDM